MASSNMTLKLLVDKRAKKVLFAEANNEFVDFLFHIFSLPLGTLIELLGSNQMVGCLGKIKESIELFNQTYLQPGIVKHDIFNPKTAYKAHTLLLSNDPSSSVDEKPHTRKTVYKCSYTPLSGSIYDDPCGFCSTMYVTEYQDVRCPNCARLMNIPLTFFRPPKKDKTTVDQEDGKKKGGYVKEMVTYMVMDDLVVKPMSTISRITLVNSFGVKDLSHLEEKTLPFGKDEALQLLKASLITNQVLTTLFRHTVDI